MLPIVLSAAAKSSTENAGRHRSSAASPATLFDQLSAAKSLPGNKKVFKKGEPANYLYQVKSGCVRTYSDLDRGRRRIYAFYFPGDYFGLEADEKHTISAETVTPSNVRIVKSQELASRADRDIVAANLLLHLTKLELNRTQNHNLLLLKGANERVVEFFREIQRRNRSRGEINLPMPRSDIADYLGLTVETVSRALTRLKNASTISMLTYRRVILRGPVAPG
jgi:CRP/FNR family transcriptional regulator, nitrogen fixation regulation protein